MPLELLAKDYWDCVETGTNCYPYANPQANQHNISHPTSHESNDSFNPLLVFLTLGTRKIEVEYGNDLDTSQYQSGFHPKLSELSGIETGPREEMFTEEYYQRTGWNLNNIAATDGSVLKYLKTEINGVNVPWLYVGT